MFQLVDIQSNVVAGPWSSAPNPLFLPNGDVVCGAEVGGVYGGWTMTSPAPVVPPPPTPTPADVYAERDRRLAAGFDYDFGDSRGVQRIGTTPDDMTGWNEVTTWATVENVAGNGTAQIAISTDTSTIAVTAAEWFQVLGAAAAFRQPIWDASFILIAADPIPSDYTDDTHW